MKGNPCLTEEEKTGSASLGAPVFDVVDSRCEEEEVFSRDGPREMWETTSGSQPFDDETISFPLSQPDPPSRKQHHVSAVQRRRRSAACCSAPYMGAGQHQRLAGPPSATHGSATQRQHTPPAQRRSHVASPTGASCEKGPPTAEEAEKVSRELAKAAVASAQSLAADAKAIDPAYTAKPTGFLYKGHTAQIATSTAGMYGEMIESFVKQVVAYAREYGADEFSVFCDLGSGRGAPSAIAAYEHQWLACLGIEKCPQAFSLSLETQRTLLLRESSQRLRPSEASQSPESCLQSDEGLTQEELKVLFECRPQRAVAFAHDDLSAFVDLEGVTHGYSFDAAMEGPLINQYGRPSL